MADEEMVDVKRFQDLAQICSRPSAFSGPGFDVENPPCWNQIKILCVGAGGLGCEVLHCLALTGFVDVTVIDMDTIDLTNLNRQFLFRHKDIHQPKATVAAEFINRRFPWMEVKPIFDRIENQSNDFYLSFQIVIMGVDSIKARQWMSRKYASLRTPVVNDDGSVEWQNVVPIIDGGTEGFKGSTRHITFGESACIDCAMYLYPPRTTVPFCTLENVPRVPEHCVLYVKEKLWDDLKPFGGAPLDGDNADHCEWIAGHARTRQAQFQIAGTIDFRFTQGVVKNVVAAVGFTNAMIAAMCVSEAFKLATGVVKTFSNYMYYDGGGRGVCSYTQELLVMPGCEYCQLVPATVGLDWTPQQLVDDVLPVLQRAAPADKKLEAGDKFMVVALVPNAVQKEGYTYLSCPASHPAAASVAAIERQPLHDYLKGLLDAKGQDSATLLKGLVINIGGGKLGTESRRFSIRFK